MDISKFKELPIMGIVRGLDKEQAEPFFECVAASGLKTIEFALNSQQAVSLIKAFVRLSKDRLTIGAGTVLNLEDAKKALDAGATFIVLPVLISEVVDYCRDKAIAVFPGALTPQEIYRAWCQGATMVKVFPAKVFGPSYFKEVKAPFDDMELLACGGVNAQNISGYFSAGASAVAFGSSIFKKDLLKNKKYPQISSAVKALIQAYKKLK
ncbi:MAG: bifunctional 4-hydroxy-2-oxoglutarate aldolase/2-dehydro-3-deoxy-phosphogluconate aldolase [Candidatus Omnitrophica bacterium]|nr:bifunctional 4-hydroxy-2-oxoglutarate aldolase/2-dehydro-3-deoxy-phosphogluconate aldolase [Candidatus Omnitrophota bacterium]